MNLRGRIDADEIRRLYVDEHWTTAQLADYYQCAEVTIIRRLQDLGIARRPRGPFVDRDRNFVWSPELAYAVGLIATDGNLSPDGRHITVTSKDRDLLETLRDCLSITTSITASFNPRMVYRLAWSDRYFYDCLLSIGLMPAKSLRLGPLTIPDAYLADFMRGCVDGDGSIITYTDRYNTVKSEKYIYERLFVVLVSASGPFLDWVQASIMRLTGLHGACFSREPGNGRNTMWTLKFAKYDSIRLLNWMYYTPTLPCLARKRAKALPFLMWK